MIQLQRIPKPALQLLICVVIIGLALGASKLLKHLSTHPTKRVPTRSINVVQTLRIDPTTQTLHATGYGTVSPWASLPIVSQVSGQIVSIPKALQPGQTLQADELILAVDPTEYDYQYDAQLAELARAELALKEATGSHRLAQKEWALIKAQSGQSAPTFENKDQEALALRTAQLEEKKRLLAAAKSAVKLAELNRQRTRITAPCQGVVLSVTVAKGQVISPGSTLLTLACLAKYKIIASFPEREMRLIPEWHPGQTFPARIGGYPARVSYRLPQLDDQTQMQQLLIEVDQRDAPGLRLGQYSSVEVNGRQWDGLYKIPEAALREGNTLWLITENETLAIKPVNLIHSEASFHYVQDPEGINQVLNLITSPISAPYVGMPLKDQAQNDRQVPPEFIEQRP